VYTIRSNGAPHACNCNRCRCVKEDGNAVKAHDRVSLTVPTCDGHLNHLCQNIKLWQTAAPADNVKFAMRNVELLLYICRVNQEKEHFENFRYLLDTLLNLTAHWSTHHTTYWQHSDHLGSASWVTDTNGLGYQHLLYMPWGEPLLDQRAITNSYETRYTFSGKERDEETGYSYFGARYYNSDLSIWLSVDPMSDKYPSLSPYVYCGNNPVKLVDPNGEEIDGPDDPPKNVFQRGWGAFKRFDDYLLSGHSDGANRGTITKQDVAVGGAVIATIVTAGAALEAESAIEATIAVASTINNVDDATVNSSGQTIAQRASSTNPTANKAVNGAKTMTSVALAGYSGYKVGKVVKDAVKNGAQVIKENAVKVATEVANFASNTYSSIKSFFKKVNNHAFIQQVRTTH